MHSPPGITDSGAMRLVFFLGRIQKLHEKTLVVFHEAEGEQWNAVNQGGFVGRGLIRKYGGNQVSIPYGGEMFSSPHNGNGVNDSMGLNEWIEY
ncbi:hypothetical protein TNCV_3780741 [Trichonephila clavipes]|nr:hypothetical protein TNCV_3780741 [Trichonephila clavipes]